MTKVIHIRDKTGSSDEVYIGRGSKWGNPYKIGGAESRASVIRLYEDRLYQTVEGRELLGNIEELRGKTLVCYCKPQACHGDVLVNILNRIGEDNDK